MCVCACVRVCVCACMCAFYAVFFSHLTFVNQIKVTAQKKDGELLKGSETIIDIGLCKSRYLLCIDIRGVGLNVPSSLRPVS